MDQLDEALWSLNRDRAYWDLNSNHSHVVSQGLFVPGAAMSRTFHAQATDPESAVGYTTAL